MTNEYKSKFTMPSCKFCRHWSILNVVIISVHRKKSEKGGEGKKKDLATSFKYATITKLFLTYLQSLPGFYFSWVRDRWLRPIIWQGGIHLRMIVLEWVQIVVKDWNHSSTIVAGFHCPVPYITKLTLHISGQWNLKEMP